MANFFVPYHGTKEGHIMRHLMLVLLVAIGGQGIAWGQGNQFLDKPAQEWLKDLDSKDPRKRRARRCAGQAPFAELGAA